MSISPTQNLAPQPNRLVLGRGPQAVVVEWDPSVADPITVDHAQLRLTGRMAFRAQATVTFRRASDAAPTFHIYRGFRFDGASVPRLFWCLPGFAPVGVHLWAALLHDMLCENPQLVSRSVADAMFFDLLRASGLGWRAWVMAAAVRLYALATWLRQGLQHALCGAVLLLCGATAFGQCFVDPATGRQVCPLQRPQPPAANRPTAQTALPLPQRCRIYVGDGHGPAGSSVGSGSLILSDKLVLTCAHLFDDCRSGIVVVFPDGRRFGGTLAELDRANDLAAVVIQSCGVEPLPIGDLTRSPADECVAGGFGGDGRFAIVRGRVVRFATIVGSESPSAVMQGQVRPGDSGGGVVDGTKSLVGVLWGARDGETYFTTGRPLAAFLARFGYQGAPPLPTPSPQPPAPSPQPPSTCCCACGPRLAAFQAELEKLRQRLADGQRCPCDHDELAATLHTLTLRLAAAEEKLASPSHQTAAPRPFYIRVDPEAAYTPVYPGQYVTLPLTVQRP